MKRCVLPLHLTRRGRSLTTTEGFSMVELLVSGAVGTIVISSVATIGNSTQAKVASARAANITSVEVASNLAAVRNLADVFAWTSDGSGGGTGTVASNSNVCDNKGLGKANENARKKHDCTSYFIPSKKDETAAFASFENACKDNSPNSTNLLLAPLISSIAALPKPAGVERTVTVQDGRAKQLLVRYTGGEISRGALITPKLASLCP